MPLRCPRLTLVRVLGAAGVLALPSCDFGPDASLPPLPPGHPVAYVSQGLGGSLDIFLLSADGQSDVNLTSFTSYEAWPSWSPDGSQMAFESNGGEETDPAQTEIYVMTVGIPGVQRLTSDTLFTNAQPAWSPLGDRIAFVSDRDSAAADIYLMNPSGTAVTRITTDTTNEVHPAWAPNGSKIAFATDRDGDNGEIYVMDTTGANLQRLTNDPAADVAPAWSPDGAKIAFQSTRETGRFGIWVMDAADGGNPARVSPTSLICELPSWTPDGIRLAFDCDADIWVANANGSGLTRITRTSNLQRGEVNARWRPQP